MPYKILLVFGTRPEAIKMAPVVLALKADPRFECVVCLTGQHREMLEQVTTLFGIEADYSLDLMAPGQELAGFYAKAIEQTGAVIQAEKPAMVLIQGDTSTALAAAHAAYFQHVPVGHVEAGLRTSTLWSPWPEEGNRRMVSAITTLHFAPTQWASQNLLRENIPAAKVIVTGNTVVDALLWARDRIHHNGGVFSYLNGKVPEQVLEASRRTVLITGHRRENFGGGLENLCEAIRFLAQKHPGVDFVYPVHPNPRVRDAVSRCLGFGESDSSLDAGNIHLIEPLAYMEFVSMMDLCKVILTDSGGIQEEAPALGKPVLVTRDTTERPEAVEAGVSFLIGTERQAIIDAVNGELAKLDAAVPPPAIANPYGSGKAALAICQALAQFLASK